MDFQFARRILLAGLEVAIEDVVGELEDGCDKVRSMIMDGAGNVSAPWA